MPSPHTLQKHPTLPIVMRTYDSSFSMQDIDPSISEEDEVMINAQPHPTYYLADLLAVTMDFQEIMLASSRAAGQTKTYTNPNVIESLVVVPNRILEMTAEGLRSPVYGNLRIRAFRSVADAIDYVKRQLEDA